MRHFFRILSICLLLSGCVSQQKYDDLQAQNLELAKRVHELKQENDTLNKELDTYHQAAQFYYKSGTDFYAEGRYGDALEAFDKLTDRFPTSPLVPSADEKITAIKNMSTANYETLLKSLQAQTTARAKIDLLDRELKEKYFTKEHAAALTEKKIKLQHDSETQKHMTRNIVVEDDQTRKAIFYRTTRPVEQQVGYDKKFYVELYVVQKYSGKKSYRLKTRFSAPDYLSYDTVVLQGDNGTRVEVKSVHPRKQSAVEGSGIAEWSDDEITDEEKVNRLARSNSISVQFKGGYKYSFEMDEEEIAAFRDLVRKYQSLKPPDKNFSAN
jgi:outer membrane murein-binding lipoprotein Lpp